MLRYPFYDLQQLELKDEDFKYAINIVTRIHLKSRGGISLQNIPGSLTKRDILEALWAHENWMREEDLIEKVRPKLRQYFRNQLPELIESRVIKQGPGGSYKYSDGIVRMLVRFHLDNEVQANDSVTSS